MANVRLWIVLAAISALIACAGKPAEVEVVEQTDILEELKARPAYKLDQLEGLKIKSVAYYVEKLTDEEFIWTGPASRGYSIPANHGLRALAFVGDAAVPSLLRLAQDRSVPVDLYDIYEALAEIGLPVHDYPEILEGDVRGISLWWREHQEDSLPSRTAIRNLLGLPPPNLYDIEGQRHPAEASSKLLGPIRRLTLSSAHGPPVRVST